MTESELDGYPIDGSCQCGQVTYRVKSSPIFVTACHCTECQKQSASAFGISMGLTPEALEIDGELKFWERTGDNGNISRAHFCPDCGVRIFHTNPDRPEFIRLRPGTLSKTAIVNPTLHVWVSQKQAWVIIPDGVEQHETQPEY